MWVARVLERIAIKWRMKRQRGAEFGRSDVCFGCRVYSSNENKMSDGERDRASLGVEV